MEPLAPRPGWGHIHGLIDGAGEVDLKSGDNGLYALVPVDPANAVEHEANALEW